MIYSNGLGLATSESNRRRAGASTAHGRYKDLAVIEAAFRTGKNVIPARAGTGHLQRRPIYVRSRKSTRGACSW